jgi:hypothetical protein
VYIDFKNWGNFDIDSKEELPRVQRKLKRINGNKVLIINTFKRGEHKVVESVENDVIEIPYIFDQKTGKADEQMLNYIVEKHLT